MGITKDVAFAFFKTLEDHDIEWLNGDYSTLFDKLSNTWSKIQEIEKVMKQEYDQTPIDLTKRVNVSAEVMKDAGWDIGDDNYATVQTVSKYASEFGLVGEGEQDYAINLTPILPDGTVIEGGEKGLEDWVREQLGDGKDIKELDIFLGSYKTMEEAQKKAQRLHELQEIYYDAVANHSFENDIYGAMQKMADLNAQLASGKITAKEYAEQFGKVNTEYEAAKKASRENIFGEDGVWDRKKTKDEDIDGFLEANQKVVDAQEKVTESTQQLTEATTKMNEAKTAYGEDSDEYKKAKEDVEDLTDQVIKNQGALQKAVELREKFTEPTEAEIKIAMDDIEKDIQKAGGKFDAALEKYFDVDENGYYILKANLDMKDVEDKVPGIKEYVALLNSRTQLNAYANTGPAEISLNDLSEQIQDIIDLLTDIKVSLDKQSQTTFLQDCQNLLDSCGLVGKVINIGVKAVTGQYSSEKEGDVEVNGTAHAKGTAHKSGNWGLRTSERDALVGELGTELVVNPHTGRYYTVGDHGAEMVDLPKDAIIFNHKQTEGLLNNGHINSRGKAYAEGNAHVTIWPNESSKDQWKGTGYSGPDDSTYDAADALSDAADSMSDAADEFREVFNWIEVRLEEINERIDLKSAQLENNVGYAAKNKTIDQIIEYHKALYDNLIAGANKYYAYAKTLLAKVPSAYRDAAQDGTIAIETFVGEVDEKSLEAIKDYRDWVQKGADVTQQAEETLTAIRDLAIQRIDNAQESGDVRVAIEEAQTEKLQNAVDYDEERGLITSPAYYKAMKENSRKEIEYLTTARKAMQEEFNTAVKKGELKRGSNEWYEQLEKLYDMDSQIDQATIELEEFQNSINDIYWDNFDELINRLDYIQEEAQSLIDLFDNADMVVTPETDDGWSADQVEWTEEGIASMGLYAQQMEIAEYKSRQYAEAIDDLTKDYKKGLYSRNEYLEKLNELKQAQYENIEAYHEAQDAIVQLNETRVEAIKEGIEKEIAAYEELIQKKKEELDTEKDLYDFQKTSMEQQKNISDIQRKIAALAGDNSASAAAKRKQLEAELLEARQDQEELYYERSIDNQQTALDKELEDFQAEKDAELTKWDEYLTNVETVVTDSLNLIQANALGVYDTLSSTAEEYNLTLSHSILTPWQDGVLAVSDYQNAFDTAASSTTDKLEAIKDRWQEVIDKMAQVSQTNVDTINKENANYAKAEKKTKKPKQTSNDDKNKSTNKKTTSTKSIKVGGKINAKGAKIYDYAGDTSGENQYYSSDPIYVVLEEKSGYLKVRHHKSSSGVSGWFKKADVKAYAKGSKGVLEDQWAWIDELGEELQLIPGANGRLEYVKKGTGIVPADLTERLMDLAMNPQEVLDRNRPQITPSKSVVNNNMEIHVDASVGELLHVEHLDGNNPNEISKIVNKAWDKKMEGLNSAIKKFTR
jgi:hypothetical protein